MRLDPVFAWCAQVIDALWLNLLWLVSCALVVTAPAGTVAMVATVRDMQCGRIQGGVLRTFVRQFRASGKTATVVGMIWLGVIGVLLLDFAIVRHLGDARQPVFILLTLGAALAVFSTAFLASAIVSTPGERAARIIRQAALVAAAQPGATLQVLLALFVAAFAVLTMPLLVFIAPVLAAHAAELYWKHSADALLSRSARLRR